MNKPKKMVVKTVESKLAHRVKKVAAYARVSTLQDAQEDSYESQVAYYSAMIQANPKWEYAGVYADKGISGTQAKKRPEFMRMVRDAKNGMIDLIYVKSISRFARNTMDATKYVHELKAIGVEVVFEREGISSFDPSADMVFNLLAAMAQEESRSISENTRWAFVKKAEQGILHLGSNQMLGFDQEGDKLVPNADAWIVRLVFEEYASGITVSQIIRNLKGRGALTFTGKDTFDSSTIYHMLANEKYVGDLLIQKSAPVNYLTKRPDYTKDYDSYFIEDDHEAIVDRETWNVVQAKLAVRKKRQSKRINEKHVLAGKVICHECGGECIRFQSHGVTYWRCRNHREGQCPVAIYFSEDRMIEQIEERLGEYVTEEQVKRHVRRVVCDADRTITVEFGK